MKDETSLFIVIRSTFDLIGPREIIIEVESAFLRTTGQRSSSPINPNIKTEGKSRDKKPSDSLRTHPFLEAR